MTDVAGQSEEPRGDALVGLRGLVEARREAPSQPVRKRNRLTDQIRGEAMLLAGSAEGRAALLRAAASDQDQEVRLVAALAVETWDVSKAVRALESLIMASGGTVVRPMTMTAALEVPYQDQGMYAALCLYNIDRGEKVSAAATATSYGPVVRSADLDAAEAVYSAVMNGGLDHAFATLGPSFGAAASAFEVLGAPNVSDALREVLLMVSSGPGLTPSSLADRERLLAGLSDPDVERLEVLNDVFEESQLMVLIECAEDG